MRRQSSILAATITFLLAGTIGADAQIPELLSWQGVLLEQNRAPVADGTYSVTVRLYSTASGGTALWQETDQVTTFDGVFTTILGDGTPLTLPFDAPYWLAVEIQGEPEMTPRVPLVSMPYALNALRSTTATTADRARVADSIAGGLSVGVRSLNGLGGDLHLVGRGGTTVGIAGDTIVITSGGDRLPANASEGDIIRFDATANRWVATTMRVQTSPRITGDGSTGAPLDIAPMGASDGSVLRFDASTGTWGPATIGFSVATASPLLGDGSNGSPVRLADGVIDGQGLFWNGTAWTPSAAIAPQQGDFLQWDATNRTWRPGRSTIATSPRLSGDGSTGSPLDIAQMGAAAGEALLWDSANARWSPGTPFIISRPPFTGTGTASAPLALGPGTRIGQILTWDGSAWRVTSGESASTGDLLTWDPTLGWRPRSSAVTGTAGLAHGSLWVGGANDTATTLPIGAADQVLAVLPDGSAPVWTGSLRLDSIHVDDLQVRGDGRIDGSLSVGGPNVDLPARSIDNSELVDSTIRVIVGAGLSGDTVISLGGSLNLRNTGVTSIRSGDGISVDSSTGVVTVSNLGVTSAVAGRGIAVDSATGRVTFTNVGVVETRAGRGISVDSATGAVTVTNAGVVAAQAGRGIALDSTTGTVTIDNSGVLEARAGRGISVDSATGVVTFSNDGLLGARAGLGIDVVIANDSATITNTGVRSIAAGGGISIDSTTGAVTVTNTGVTALRGTTNQVIVSDSTGAITVSLPQDIHTDATPTFDGITLDNLNSASTADQVVVSNSGTIESRPFTSLFPGGLLPAGTTPNSTLRWNGSAWVENGAVRGDSLGNLASDADVSIGGDATIAGDLTVNGTTVTLPNGSVDNNELANSSIAVAYGSGLSGDLTVALGDTLAVRNTGVVAAQAGRGIALDSTTGTVTIDNIGVLEARAGRGISVDSATGIVTFSNDGLLGARAGLGIDVVITNDSATITNTGVTALRGTTNQVIASDSTGTITLSLPQDIHTDATPTFDGITLDNLSASSTSTDLLVSNGGSVATRTVASLLSDLPLTQHSLFVGDATGRVSELPTTSSDGAFLRQDASGAPTWSPLSTVVSTLADSIGNGFWRTTGNIGTDATTDFIGTGDSTMLVMRVDSAIGLRLIPGTVPSIIGGSETNVRVGNSIGITIGGGYLDTISGNSSYSVIAGGERNRIDSSTWSTIGGGLRNKIEAHTGQSVLTGGYENMIRSGSDYAVLAGGSSNRIDSSSRVSTIGGGISNRIEPSSDRSTIAGGAGNIVGRGTPIATIAGGQENRIESGAFGAFVGGGYQDSITGNSAYANIPGGEKNRIDSSAWATIGGGLRNSIESISSLATIGGGERNRIARSGRFATIAGGRNNTVDSTADYFAIGGGEENFGGYGAWHSAILGGSQNRITARSLTSAILGGRSNTIDSADNTTILGGRGLTLRGDNSIGYLANNGANDMTIDGANIAFLGNVDLWLANSSGLSSRLKFFTPHTGPGPYPTVGVHYSSFQAAANQTTDIEYVLPDAAGSANQLLTIDSVDGNRRFLTWSGAAQGWSLTGNAATDPLTDFLGTTDFQGLVIRVNNDTALRIEPQTFGNVNIVAGHAVNGVGSGSTSSVISGGGAAARANTIGVLNAFSTIGGGGLNRIGDSLLYATIGGGFDNNVGARASYATVGGGEMNEIRSGSVYATIAGGSSNIITDSSAWVTIGGGSSNLIHDSVSYATIAGGRANVINRFGAYGTIAGGTSNQILSNTDAAAIGGGASNDIEDSAHYGVIGGGLANTIRPDSRYGAIGGGWDNEIEASNQASTIGGGSYHVIEENGLENTIGGGTGNTIADSANYGTIGGGWTNDIGRQTVAGTIGGGRGNEIDSTAREATIGGGVGNWIGVQTDGSTVGGGTVNVINDWSDWSTIGGGFYNRVDSLNAASTVGGGRGNVIARRTNTGVIGGGDTNTIGVSAHGSTIAGGRRNAIGDTLSYSTIGGGSQNYIGRYTENATIAGGFGDTIGQNADHSSILGGFDNEIAAQTNGSTIAGGVGMTLSGSRSFGFNGNSIFGGKDMEISDGFSAVFANVDLWLANNKNLASAIRFYEPYNTSGAFPGPVATRAYFTSFEAPALTDTIRYVLPATKGAAGDVLEIAAVNGDEVTLEWDTDDDSSDERFKRNIRPLTGALDSTLMLRGVRYDWRRDEFTDRNFPETESIGFIAQEVEAIFPELVETESDGYKKVDYAKVSALLVEALRQQQEQIDAQSDEIAELRRMIEQLARMQAEGDRGMPDAR